MTRRIPNIPFFYLVYRAWSHWRAFSGGKHIEALLNKRLVVARSNQILDTLYSSSDIDLSKTFKGEELVLKEETGKLIAKELGLPELWVEIDRAIEQVKATIEKESVRAEKIQTIEQSPSSSNSKKVL